MHCTAPPYRTEQGAGSGSSCRVPLGAVKCSCPFRLWLSTHPAHLLVEMPWPRLHSATYAAHNIACAKRGYGE